MRFTSIGDNCIDVYERLNIMFSTGNVVDTGVNMQLLGIPTSIFPQREMIKMENG